MGKSGYHRGCRGITRNWALVRNWRCRRCQLGGGGWHGYMGRCKCMGSPGSRGRGVSRPGRGCRLRRRGGCWCMRRLGSRRRSMSRCVGRGRRRSRSGSMSWRRRRSRSGSMSWRRRVSGRRSGKNRMCSHSQDGGDHSYYRAHQGKDEQHEAQCCRCNPRGSVRKICIMLHVCIPCLILEHRVSPYPYSLLAMPCFGGQVCQNSPFRLV